MKETYWRNHHRPLITAGLCPGTMLLLLARRNKQTQAQNSCFQKPILLPGAGG